MIEITAIRLAGGRAHEHVSELQWRRAATALSHSPRAAIIEWLGASGENRAVIVVGSERVPLAVMGESDQTPYLRARRDGHWTDDLLELPRF